MANWESNASSVLVGLQERRARFAYALVGLQERRARFAYALRPGLARVAPVNAPRS
jgi:hypothetical protein